MGGFGSYGLEDVHIRKLCDDKMDLQPSGCGKPSDILWESPFMRLVMILLMISCAIGADVRPACADSSRAESQEERSRLARLVQRHFQRSTKYCAQRLLTQAEAESLFDQFRGIGVQIPAKNALLRRLPSEREAFTRMIIPYLNTAPQSPIRFPAERTYAILDHLSRNDRGLETIQNWMATGQVFTAAALEDDPLIPPLEWGLVADIKERLVKSRTEKWDRIYTVEGLLAAISDAH